MVGRDMSHEYVSRLHGVILVCILIVVPFFNGLIEPFIVVETTNAKFEGVLDGNDSRTGDMVCIRAEKWNNIVLHRDNIIDGGHVSECNVDEPAI